MALSCGTTAQRRTYGIIRKAADKGMRDNCFFDMRRDGREKEEKVKRRGCEREREELNIAQ